MLAESLRFFLPGRFLFLVAAVLLVIDASHKYFDIGSKALALLGFAQSSGPEFWLLIFMLCILECIFVVSFYFPGSLVLFGLILSLDGGGQYFEAGVVVYLGFMSGAAINFTIGRYFADLVQKVGHKLVLDRAIALIEDWGKLAIPFTSFHPNHFGTLFLALGLTRRGTKIHFLILSACLPVALSIWIFAIQFLPNVLPAELTGGFPFALSGIVFLLGILVCAYQSLTRADKE